MAPLSYPFMQVSCDDEVFESVDLSLAKLQLDERPHDLSTVAAKGRVRFNLGKISVINKTTEYYTEDDMSDRWVSNDELRQIKLEAKRMSVALRRISKERGCIVSIAHRKTTLMMKSDFRNLLKLSPSPPDEDLANWCLCNDGRRGLERFASSDYSVIRSVDVMNTRAAVIDEQERQWRDGRLVADPEVLSLVGKESSRRARTFARFMGAADAAAAKGAQVGVRRKTPARTQSEMPQRFSTIGHSVDIQGSSEEIFQFRTPQRKKSKLCHSGFQQEREFSNVPIRT